MPASTPGPKPWGRFATFALGAAALLAGQATGVLALVAWYGVGVSRLTHLGGDGAAVTLGVLAATPVQVLLLVLFARRVDAKPAAYLGLIWPRRGEVVFGAIVTVALVLASDVLSSLLGQPLVTSFQVDIYRSVSGSGWLLWLWLAIVLVTPIGEEMLFRGFLFRGWLQSPRDVWPVIAVTAALWAVIHLQYNWYVIAQVFVFGLFLGWMRWASGSALLTMLLHALINAEGMIETAIHLK